MRDSEVVAAIVAGDPDGLAEAYDRYAAPPPSSQSPPPETAGRRAG